MDIHLAGYNVDTNTLKKLGTDRDEPLTPETLSAAYARISRSPDNITALRKKARSDVAKARKSNQTIIFEYGHHSVAEHAVFNFDIMGVSRLALEEIEKLRLVSFTEKSQRYVTLEGDYLLPTEFRDSSSNYSFRDIVGAQNAFYQKAFSRLKDFIFGQYPALSAHKKNHKLLEGWAKEDARYILSLATLGQVGMTINARNLEHLLRRLALSRRQETQEIGRKIYDITKEIAPSLLLFPEPSAFETHLDGPFREKIRLERPGIPDLTPRVLHYTPEGDDLILTALFCIHHSADYEEARQYVKQMGGEEKRSIFESLFGQMEFFDTPPREFELPEITFQAVVSAASFAQLKRHRLATLLTGPYHIDLQNTVPQNIKAVDLDKEFMAIVAATNAVYLELRKKYQAAADYVLTNSHRRLVIMKMNLREMYHFTRLREDEHAQWDIRSLARSLLKEVKQVMPLSTLLLCGKSDFVERYEEIFKKKPGQLI